MHLEAGVVRMKIQFVHLLDNFTGSPRMLSNVLNILKTDPRFSISVITSKTNGFISNVNGIHIKDNKYTWRNNTFLRIVNLLCSEIFIFFKILLDNSIDIVYINTILPFSAALAGKLCHKKIIYHVHEVYTNPSIFQKICAFVMCKTATHIFVVSKYVAEFYKGKINCSFDIVYNTVSDEYKNRAHIFIKNNSTLCKSKFDNKLIIMATGLKEYKGIYQFVEIAKKLPHYTFLMIVSEDKLNTTRYFSCVKLPENLHFDYNVSDIINYYAKSSIVLCLTLPDIIKETFGMTLIEGFELGSPCIAPNAGGPKEVVEDSKNGYLVDPYNIDDIAEKINSLLSDYNTYKDFFLYALETAKKFASTSINTIKTYLDSVL